MSLTKFGCYLIWSSCLCPVDEQQPFCKSDQSGSHLHPAGCWMIVTYLAIMIISEIATVALLQYFLALIKFSSDGFLTHKVTAEHCLQMLTDTPNKEFPSVPIWCCFHKLLMLLSSFSPASNFFILGDYQWELLCNSNKQLPLLFPSARRRGWSSEGLCHVDVRTDWSRHLQLHRLHLSHLERHQHCFLLVVLISYSWQLYAIYLQLRLVCKDQYGDKLLRDGDTLGIFYSWDNSADV